MDLATVKATLRVLGYTTAVTPGAFARITRLASQGPWYPEADAWARGFLAAAGVELRHDGRLGDTLRDLTRDKRPVILCATHSSYLDSLVLFTEARMPLRFIAKEELFRSPVLGPALKATGMVSINRARARGAYEALQRAARDLGRDGGVVAIFPEGTRSRDGKVHPFKKGAFVMGAACEGCALLPAALRGTFRVWGDTFGAIRPGPVELRVGDALLVEEESKRTGLTDLALVEHLRSRTEGAVRALFSEGSQATSG
ncbi:MAG: 1-acyl-sn-glycerol-3-phosphate acyltransferase [Deltaproteobacteria bacterium]|nr:1-acyl-sn-glycerol-3-phosphate acyltransferase [Deltaproteobacteria bacterium]